MGADGPERPLRLDGLAVRRSGVHALGNGAVSNLPGNGGLPGNSGFPVCSGRSGDCGLPVINVADAVAGACGGNGALPLGEHGVLRDGRDAQHKSKRRQRGDAFGQDTSPVRGCGRGGCCGCSGDGLILMRMRISHANSPPVLDTLVRRRFARVSVAAPGTGGGGMTFTNGGNIQIADSFKKALPPKCPRTAP
ncbi:hypothetical protein D3C75_754010 [compost metagenome]